MKNLDALLNQIDESYEQIIALEQDLIRIPSVNTGTMPTGNETPVCEFARDWLAEIGIHSEIIELCI